MNNCIYANIYKQNKHLYVFCISNEAHAHHFFQMYYEENPQYPHKTNESTSKLQYIDLLTLLQHCHSMNAST